MLLTVGAELIKKTCESKQKEIVSSKSLQGSTSWFYSSLKLFWTISEYFPQTIKKDRQLNSIQKVIVNELPSFVFEDKDSWFCSALQTFWTMRDEFHQMINGMDKRRDFIVTQYEFYILCHKFKEEYSAFEKELSKERPDLAMIYLEEPINLAASPKPRNPLLLLDAIKLFSEAVQFGQVEDMRRSSKILKKAVKYYFQNDFNDKGKEKEPTQLIVQILKFLSENNIDYYYLELTIKIIEKLVIEQKTIQQVCEETNHSLQTIQWLISRLKKILLCKQKNMSTKDIALSLCTTKRLVKGYEIIIEIYRTNNKVIEALLKN